MSSSSDKFVGEGIMFSGCPSAAFVHSFIRPFVWTDLVTTISHERLEQCRRNLQGIFNSTYWWPV